MAPLIVAGGIAAGVNFLLLTILWGLSVKAKDASLVDRYWGLQFAILGVTVLVVGWVTGGNHWRSYVACGLVSLWGLRLSWHLHKRNRGHGEDYRYQKMRQSIGGGFWWQSLFRVFWLQGAIGLVVAMPLVFLVGEPATQGLGLGEIVGILLIAGGFWLEALADAQLKTFKSAATNQGQLLTTGVWSISRHPNYLGDAIMWWGVGIWAASQGFGWGLLGPLVMTFFLRYVSGAKLLEKSLAKTKPGYANYVRDTPVFWPTRYILGVARFAFFVAVKLFTRLFYRFEVAYVGSFEPRHWPALRLALLLNHTSLWEPLLTGVLPIGYLWRLSHRGIFPVADITMTRPLARGILGFLAPKVVAISRKRDETWQRFLAAVAVNDTMIFLPEGRMKRPDGKDKFGKAMTIRRGIADVLAGLGDGPLIFVYSGGLSHVAPPGRRLPRVFKTIRVRFESTTIAAYVAEMAAQGGTLEQALVADLSARRDRYCQW